MYPIEFNIRLYRRNRFDLNYRVPKDLTNYTVYFVVKADKLAGSTKLIEKVSSDVQQMTKSYIYPYTKLLVKIRPDDTEDFLNNKYYYELYAVNDSDWSDLEIFYFGEVEFDLSVSTPIDAGNTLSSIYYDVLTTAERLALGVGLGLDDEGAVVVYDTDDDTIYTWTGTEWH